MPKWTWDVSRNAVLTGGDPLDIHEPPGSELLMRMFSLRTLGPYGMEEGKRWGYLATSRQYGNSLLGVRQPEE